MKVPSIETIEFDLSIVGSPTGRISSENLVELLKSTAEKIMAADKLGYRVTNSVMLTVKMEKKQEVDLTPDN